MKLKIGSKLFWSSTSNWIVIGYGHSGYKIQRCDEGYENEIKENWDASACEGAHKTWLNNNQKYPIVYDEVAPLDWKVIDWAFGSKIKNNKKTFMSKISEFAKNLTLSADEKLLRKHGLKDVNGEFTEEARLIVMNKLVKDNEAHLLTIAQEADKESK